MSSGPRRRLLGVRAIPHPVTAHVVRARRAAEHPAVRLDTVPDDPALAVLADGRERMDSALETVEHVRLRALDDRERLVVFVAADFAGGHRTTPRQWDLRVRAAFFAAAERSLAERRFAAPLACRDSAVCDAALRDSRFSAFSLEFWGRMVAMRVAGA